MENSNPCRNHCQNGGVCVLPSLDSDPICYCPESWIGSQCIQPEACQNYCFNGGMCALQDGSPNCTCLEGYSGSKCEEFPRKSISILKEESHSILVPVLSAIAVIIIVLVIGFFAFDYFFKNRTFSHERLQENDFNNPIYQERDAEPFRLDPDRVRL